MNWKFASVLVAGMLFPPLSQAQNIAITGGRVLTVSHGVIENGTVLVENGKIAAVGAGIKVPSGAKVIDARNKVIMPGMFDAGDMLGLVEIPAEKITDDTTEYSDPVHPELRVLDAINPHSENIRVTRAQGITNAIVRPAIGNLVGGQAAVIQLDGDTVDQVVVKTPVALIINLGEESKQTYGKKQKAPETRMGQMAMLRQALLKAQHYRETQEAYAKKQAGKNSGNGSAGPAESGDGKSNAPPGRDLKMEALVAAMEGQVPVVARAERVSDIEMALRLADEFHLKLVLSGAASAWRLADELARRKIPVLIGPVLEEPNRMESLDVRLDNAARLYQAGVPIAFQTLADNEVRDLPFQVEYAIGYGLPEDAALSAVTLNPTRFFGLENRLGSIDVGKDANLLVLDGMPFHVKTHVVTELIAGKVIDLSNHQTELFDFYKKKYGIQ
ncbi:MAG TPA: amidohydrolase family protein [Terriglobales bacterium]|nr:amidohydrolase family protein [Terriglobales bacterium]